MKATINKIRSGRYTAKHHGYIFIIESNTPNVWTISNHCGVELFKDTTKKALINTLASYSFNGTMGLHEQQYCKYA